VVSHPAWTAGQAATLYFACVGWHTAPGGDGFRRRPERVWFSCAQVFELGQKDVPGIALQ
jgi:hypothetical protein